MQIEYAFCRMMQQKSEEFLIHTKTRFKTYTGMQKQTHATFQIDKELQLLDCNPPSDAWLKIRQTYKYKLPINRV